MSLAALPPDNPLLRVYRAVYGLLFGPAAYSQGTWNATTNSPALASGVGVLGNFYTVATAGTTTLDGINSWAVNDIVAFNGLQWVKNPVNALSTWVLPGNRVDFSQNDDNPQKNMIADADTPEIQLVDEGGTFNPHANSSQCDYVMNLGIYCSTGDLRLPIVSAMNWYIMVNMGNWRQSLPGIVKWRNENIVKNFVMSNVQIGESNPERNRGIKGWNCLWRFQLDLRISTVNLTYTES